MTRAAELAEGAWEPDAEMEAWLASAELDVSTAGEDEVPAEKCPRRICIRCRHLEGVCICSAIPPEAPYKTATRVVILQHPKEAQRAGGTAPLLRLGLDAHSLRVVVASRMASPAEDDEVHDATLGRKCALVCPGKGARQLEDVACHMNEGGGSEPLSLIFVDGRWSQVRHMLERSPWLRQLPRVVLRPQNSSGYVFRQQPKHGLVSTLEAVAAALEVLEAPACEAARGLRGLFAHMVSMQCKYIPVHCDKNAPRAACDEPVSMSTQTVTAEDEGRPLVLCRWSKRGAAALVGSGPGACCGLLSCVVVEQRLPAGCTVGEAIALAKEVSSSRPKGKKPWLLALARVPPDATWECS